MKLKFQPGYFNIYHGDINVSYGEKTLAHKMADVAQDLFDKWLSEQPLVFGTADNYSTWYKQPGSHDSHVAKLVDIQPIEKPKCEHNSIKTTNFFGDLHRPRYECADCGKKMKQTFTEAE